MNCLERSLLVAFIFTASLTYGNAKLSSEAFLAKVRIKRPAGVWASMKGKALHKVHGSFSLLFAKKRTEVPFDLAFSFDQAKLEAQAVVNNINSYRVTQNTRVLGSPAVVTLGGQQQMTSLIDFGILPSDFVLEFLYWEIERELESERLGSGFVDCRVLLMKKKSSTTKLAARKQSNSQQEFRHAITSADLAKVYISVEGLFPIKVEWFSGNYTEGDEPIRTLEISKSVTVNGMRLPGALRSFGEDWSTRIVFPESKIVTGNDSDKPDNLFSNLN